MPFSEGICLHAALMVFATSEHDIFTIIDNISFLAVRKLKKWARTYLNRPKCLAATGKLDQKLLMTSSK